ncbi:hypothetical protein [Natrinema soli]|uniref:Uncharacterized protein n=1 Tax=Natrinema soli TaxID=1930624 RepID=A0ABD5SJ08_9EURY|nr:hypothetical protein [Natrinema soli]
MSSESEQASAECRHCETTLTGDDLTYRVLYGNIEHAHDDVVSEKQVAGPGEEIEPGTDERYYCFDCYKAEYDREKGAHFEYESADELWAILEASNGRLVADSKPMTIGGRGWFRVVDGEVEARHSVMVRGGDEEHQNDYEEDYGDFPDWDDIERCGPGEYAGHHMGYVDACNDFLFVLSEFFDCVSVGGAPEQKSSDSEPEEIDIE